VVKAGAPVSPLTGSFSKPASFRTFASQPAVALQTDNGTVDGSTKVEAGVAAHPGIKEDIAAANARDEVFLMQPHYRKYQSRPEFS
jgi:hypothetical protein